MFRTYTVPPGVCVAIGGGVAAIYTVLPAEQMSPSVRLAFIASITLLTVGEIIVLHRERARQQRELAAIQSEGFARFQVTVSRLRIVEQIQQTTSTQTFKRHALEVLKDLLDFWDAEWSRYPKIGVTALHKSASAETGRLLVERKKAEEEFAAAYKVRFGLRIENLVEELRAKKLSNDRLDEAMRQEHVDLLDLAVIGRELEGLIKQL